MIKVKSIALVTILLLSSPVSASHLLRKGRSGKDVVLLQYNLKQLGYYNKTTPSTGYFGKTTNARVRQFQKANGLVVDGIVGPKTKDALNQALKNNNFNVNTVGAQINTEVKADSSSGMSATAYFYRGLKQTNFAEALSDYDKAIELNPNLAEAYYRRGMLQQIRGL